MRFTPLVLGLLLFTPLPASDMIFTFKSPVFNGINYSGHVFTQENLARTRKQAIKDTSKNEAEQAKIQAQNTPLNAFINNLQARIYSQLAAQVTEQIFNAGGATFGIINLQGGATITWTRSGDFATLYIFDPALGNTTQITVPIGSFTPTG
jgi:ABC-type taurine transport system substrate-binding protein